MMAKLDEVITEISALLEMVEKLQPASDLHQKLVALSVNYEDWYSRSLNVIRQIIPERLDDFVVVYRNEKRKEITYLTYTISDYLFGVTIQKNSRDMFNPKSAYAMSLLRQMSILKAAYNAAPSVLRDITTVLRSELLDSDLDAARELLRAQHLRSAGVICGVVIEAHLKAVLQRRAIKISKKDPSIGDLNELAKKEGVYDVPMWRLIQRLADIRNLCGHSKDREPTKEEVEDLINGTDKVIKEVF